MPIRIGKKSIICLSAVGAVLCIIVALTLMLPLLVDQRAVKERLTSELSRQLNADVRIEQLGLSLLIRPHLSLHGVVCGVHNSYSLTIKDVCIYPSLRALLTGKLEPALISLEEPNLQFQMPRQQSMHQTDTSPEEKQKKAVAYIDAALKSLPACPFEISDGTAGITAPDGFKLVVDSLDADMTASADRLSLSISCASRLWKKLAFTAQYSSTLALADTAMGEISPAVSLELEAKAIDIPTSRDMLRAFAGTDSLVSSIGADIHGGQLRSAFVTAQLLRVSDPLASATISGRGSFDNMSVAFPDMGLDVRGLSGDFSLDNSTIAARNVNAAMGKSSIHGAAIKLDKALAFKPSRITAKFDLDLSDAPGFLHLIPTPAVRSEIECIKNPRGTARGTFTLAADKDDYSTEVTISELLLQADYRAFPAPLELRRGICAYRNGLLSFSNFSGKLGASTLPDFSLSFSLLGDDHFTALAQGATVSLGDLHKVFASFAASQALIDKITTADGSLQMQNISLSGSLTTPQTWIVALDGAIENISLAVSGLEGPLAVRSGALKADQHACTLSQADLTFLDAKLTGALTLEGYLAGLSVAQAEARGMLSEKALARIALWCDMPPALALSGPVKIEQSKLVWKRGGVRTCAIDFSLARGIKAGLNLRADNETLEISGLTIRDAESQCRLGITIEEDLFSITYAGMLKKATLDRALQKNPFLQGWIQGDFSATFNQKNPRASSAKGSLAWDKAGYPAFDKSAVNITSASVTARNNMLLVESAGLTAGDDAAGMHGSVGFTDKGFVLDLTLSADSIDLDAFEKTLSPDNASSKGSADEFWETPLLGTVRLKARELKKNSFLFTPFNALFSFADKAVTMTTDDTKICSIALPATLRITPDALSLEAHPLAMKSPTKEVFQCLTGEKAIITGTVDIEGAVRAQGKPEALLDSLAGKFSIAAQDGRIYKSGLFAKILSFLSIRNLLGSGITDMAKQGYAYQSLRIEAELQGQTVLLRKAVLISSSLTLVCQGTISLKSKQVEIEALVTPFQIQNEILAKIPLVGATLSKPMIGVPLKITGMLDDPQISPRAPTAVGKEVMKITTDILKLPIKLIEPIWPRQFSGDKQ